MCIWVDENAYADNVDEIKLYEYIQVIIDTQAKKKRFFKREDDYFDFSAYFATKIFMRYRDHRQDNIDENGKRELERIKSVSNYVQQTIFFNKLLFMKDIRGDKREKATIGVEASTQFRDSLVETMDYLRVSEFRSAMNNVASTIRTFMNKIPYKAGSVEWHRIYMSCLLTIMNYITLSKDRKRRVDKSNSGGQINERCLNKQFQNERLSGVKLYRLDSDMSQYIYVLTNKIMKEVAHDLTETLGCYIPTEDMVNAVVEEGIFGEDEDQ